MSAAVDFSHSDFVEKTGADNVCERAVVCADGKLIVPKTAENGITADATEVPVFIKFARE